MRTGRRLEGWGRGRKAGWVGKLGPQGTRGNAASQGEDCRGRGGAEGAGRAEARRARAAGGEAVLARCSERPRRPSLAVLTLQPRARHARAAQRRRVPGRHGRGPQLPNRGHRLRRQDAPVPRGRTGTGGGEGTEAVGVRGLGGAFALTFTGVSGPTMAPLPRFVRTECISNICVLTFEVGVGRKGSFGGASKSPR